MPCTPLPTPTPTVLPGIPAPPGLAPLAMALVPLAMALLGATGQSYYSSIFAAAFKKLKKQKKMEKKMIKKSYKRGKISLIAKAMTGQIPSPSDFLNSRDEFSVWEFPTQYGHIEFPQLLPGPGQLGLKDYLSLYKNINKFKDLEIEKKKKFFKKEVTKKYIKKDSSAWPKLSKRSDDSIDDDEVHEESHSSFDPFSTDNPFN